MFGQVKSSIDIALQAPFPRGVAPDEDHVDAPPLLLHLVLALLLRVGDLLRDLMNLDVFYTFVCVCGTNVNTY